MNALIRRFLATAEDQSALAAMAREWGADFWSEKDVVHALSVPGTALICASVGRDWQGCILGRDDGNDAELFYIYVSPAYRGSGLGRGLFEFWRHSLKASAIHLEVRPSRTEALKLYGNLGFEVVRRRKNYYGDGEDALTMKRESE